MSPNPRIPEWCSPRLCQRQFWPSGPELLESVTKTDFGRVCKELLTRFCSAEQTKEKMAEIVVNMCKTPFRGPCRDAFGVSESTNQFGAPESAFSRLFPNPRMEKSSRIGRPESSRIGFQWPAFSCYAPNFRSSMQRKASQVPRRTRLRLGQRSIQHVGVY